jgi:hypothetical protein
MLHYIVCYTALDVSEDGSVFIISVKESKTDKLLDPEDNGTTVHRNVKKSLIKYTVTPEDLNFYQKLS